MNRVIAFAYGLFSYLTFLGTFFYAIGFVGGFFVPKSVDSGSTTSERDLANAFGEQYERYRERVPRFIPRFSRTAGRAEPGTGDGP